MSIRDLLNLVSKEKRKKERVKAVQKFAVGMGVVAAAGVAVGVLLAPKSGKETREDMKKKAIDTVETIKNTVQKKAETMKDSATNIKQEVVNIIEDVHEKTEDVNKNVKKDIKDGYHEIAQDIHKTAENISDKLNKVGK